MDWGQAAKSHDSFELDACYDAHGPVHGQVRRRRLMRALGAGRAPPLLARGEIPEPARMVTSAPSSHRIQPWNCANATDLEFRNAPSEETPRNRVLTAKTKSRREQVPESSN